MHVKYKEKKGLTTKEEGFLGSYSRKVSRRCCRRRWQRHPSRPLAEVFRSLPHCYLYLIMSPGKASTLLRLKPPC